MKNSIVGEKFFCIFFCPYLLIILTLYCIIYIIVIAFSNAAKALFVEVIGLKSEKLSIGKKAASIVGIVIASMLIIIAFSGRFCNTDGAIGFMRFANFFVGAFGMAFYGMMAAIIIACACTLAGKTIKMPMKYVVHFVLMFVAIVVLVHMLTTTYLPSEFKPHMSYIYHYYDSDLGVPSFGGVVFGLLAWCLTYPLTIWGASIVLIALLAWTVYVAGDFFYKYSTGKLLLNSKSSKADIEPSETTADAVDKSVYPQNPQQKSAFQILFEEDPIEQTASPEIVSTKDPYQYADRSSVKKPITQEEAKEFLFNEDQSSKKKEVNSFFGQNAPEKQDDDYIVKGYYPKAQKEEKPAEVRSDWKIPYAPTEEPIKVVEQQPYVTEQQPKTTVVEQQKVTEQPKIAEQYKPESKAVEKPPVNTSQIWDEYIDDVDIMDVTVDNEAPVNLDQTPSQQQVFVEQPKKEEPIVQPKVVHPTEVKKEPDKLVVIESEEKVDGGVQVKYDIVSEEDLEKAKGVHQYLEYNVPPMDLLNDATIVEDNDNGERQRLAQAIVNKLAVFNIKIELADIIVGPSVTRYMFTVLSQKTRMSDFKQYSDDIKACVEAQDDIIIEAPVKGTNMIGIEVANKNKRKVVLRELLESSEFQDAKGDLIFAIGQEITGKVVVADLTKMPHLLIAGTTGSGKSVCLNCLIVSLMYKYGPEYLRFIMVDPKFVELSRYTGIPHMLTAKTITAMPDALASMDYLIAEMESRYQMFVSAGVDKITEYNKHINPKLAQKMPYLVFIVDELADLMSTNKSAFEAKLIRLAQKGRAAGIHVVLATQRPDTKIITGTIKGNLPCRMALKVSSTYDSQTIIGGGGAEKLLGYGDMLFMNPTVAGLTRIQGAYIDNDEIKALVKYSAEVNEVYYDNSVNDQIFVAEKEAKKREEEENSVNDDEGKDELYPYYKKALRYWLERNSGKASISSLQRGIGVGFNRAGRIMENLQKMGYVEEPASSDTSNRALKVLVTLEEIDNLFPDDDSDN